MNVGKHQIWQKALYLRHSVFCQACFNAPHRGGVLFLLFVFADMVDSPTSSKPDLSVCPSSPPSPQHSSSSCGPLSPPQARVSLHTHTHTQTHHRPEGKLNTLPPGLCSSIGFNSVSLIRSPIPIAVFRTHPALNRPKGSLLDEVLGCLRD